jgi:hypothetical protein
MICDIDSDCDSNDIGKRIDVLKSAIPEDWTKTIQTEIHNRKNNRTVDINVNRDSKILDFKLCTTKQLYVNISSYTTKVILSELQFSNKMC